MDIYTVLYHDTKVALPYQYMYSVTNTVKITIWAYKLPTNKLHALSIKAQELYGPTV